MIPIQVCQLSELNILDNFTLPFSISECLKQD